MGHKGHSKHMTPLSQTGFTSHSQVPVPRGPNQTGPEWFHDGGGGRDQYQQEEEEGLRVREQSFSTLFAFTNLRHNIYT